MPYLPTNYYPKNQCIEINNYETPCFYCLIDSSDVIYYAIIRIYNYITNDLVGVIYMNEKGKFYSKKEMSIDDYNNWFINNLIDYDEDLYTFQIWTDNENSFPIVGGKGESSILYINLDNQQHINLKPNKKYIWDIEVFDNKNNVWIVDGYLDKIWNELKFPKIKLYPNDRISNNDIIKTEKGIMQIKEIVNEYYENEFTSTLVKKSSPNSKTIGDKIYYGYYHFSPNMKIILPDNLDDLKIQLDIFYLDIFNDDIDNIESITDGHIGFLDYKNKIIYCHTDLLTESTNIYSYIYRDYQTFIVDNNIVYNNLNESDFYEIYSCKLKSSLNYFTTMEEIKYNFFTYKDNEKIIFNDEITLINPYQQFICEIENINLEINNVVEWSQWHIYNKFNEKIYESEKSYNSKIYLEYYKFFDTEYNIELVIHFKNNFNIKITRHFYINHIKDNNIIVNTNVDYENKCINLDMSDIILNTTPIIYDNKNEMKISTLDWFTFYNNNNLFIKEDYFAIWYLTETISFNNFSLYCKLGELFQGKIISFKSKNNFFDLSIDIDGNFYYNNNKIFSIYGEDTKPYLLTSSTPENFFPTEEDIKNKNFSKTVIGIIDERPVTKIDFFDFYNLYNLFINCSNNKISIQFLDNNNNLIYEYILNNLEDMNFSQFTLYGNINWYYFHINNNFYLNFQQEELNLNIVPKFSIPIGFEKDSIIIYRLNLLKDKEIFNETFVGKIDFSSYGDEKILSKINDYGIGGDNIYKYLVMPIYRFNDIYYIPRYMESLEIKTDWFEVGLFGTKEENNNSYLLDEKNKWYFELDVDDKTITFNSDRQIQSTGLKLPKITTTQKDYMTGTIKCKLGKIKNECLYDQDNIKYIYNFSQFANSNDIKILRLKNNLIIPVNIQLSSSMTNNQLFETPTEINFKWTQVADIENVGLYEVIYSDGGVD